MQQRGLGRADGGHDIGGGIAWSWAVRHDDRVDLLTLSSQEGANGAMAQLDRIITTWQWA